MNKTAQLALGILLTAASAQAVTLISDPFTNVALNASLAGTTPAINNGTTWTAPTSSLRGDGAGSMAISYPDAGSRTAAIDLGAGYLGTNKGTYELSMDVTHPVGASGTNWVGIGFTNSIDISTNLVGNNASPWMIYRLSGNVSVFGGTGISNALATDVTSGTSGAAIGGTYTMKIILHTSAPQWAMQAFIGNYQIDLNGAATGSTYTFTTNPTTRYIAFGNGVNSASGTISTIDNFQLNFTAVPEPASALLGFLSLVPLALRRRR